MTKHILRMLALALAALLCFCGCGGQDAAEQPNDERAMALSEDLAANPSPFFSKVEGVDTLPAALCVLVRVDRKTAYFLQDQALPSQTPETAEAVLLAVLTTVQTAGGKQEGVYDCDLLYGTPDGSLSVTIAKGLRLEKGKQLSALLKERFTFSEGEPSLPKEVAAYGEKLRGLDFAAAIDACRDQYDDARAKAPLDKAVFGEPLVYLTDAEAVCGPVPGNDLYAHPAEQDQYVPPMTGAYERPAVGGPIGVGLARLGKADGSAYTLAEVRSILSTEPEAFCFCEVTGQLRYGSFATSDGKAGFTAYTYEMRFSLIGMDGTLLGYRTVDYPKPKLSSLEKQFVGNQLSQDKNGTCVLPWVSMPYRSVFFGSL